MSIFPGSTPSFTGFTSSHTLAQDQHASQHNSEQAEIIALANKIGTGASTPASSLVLRGTDVGTSAWGQVTLTSDVTGVLPQANGGTGTTLKTGTGAAAYQTSPSFNSPSFVNATGSLNTPTIADFSNANHTHATTAQGGQIANSGITGVNTDKLFNPYKFSVYQNSAQTINATTSAVIAYDTETFDTGTNVDVVTNKGRFTVPIAGFYFFSAAVNFGAAGVAADKQFIIYLQKNGVEVLRGNSQTVSVVAGVPGVLVSGMLQLSISDFVEVGFNNGDASNRVTNTGANLTYFHGFLVSTT